MDGSNIDNDLNDDNDGGNKHSLLNREPDARKNA
jgi:hypothetical protein